MPSALPGFVSGGAALFSGSMFSGTTAPIGQVCFRLGADASGAVYIGMATGYASGGITITSGGALTSGGMADGIEVSPGGTYALPSLLCSGRTNLIRVAVPAAVSGRCRLYWELR